MSPINSNQYRMTFKLPVSKLKKLYPKIRNFTKLSI